MKLKGPTFGETLGPAMDITDQAKKLGESL